MFEGLACCGCCRWFLTGLWWWCCCATKVDVSAIKVCVAVIVAADNMRLLLQMQEVGRAVVVVVPDC